MAGENDGINGAFRTLTDGKWEWHRDPKAIAVVLTWAATLILSALAYATTAGLIPPIDDGDAETIDVEAIETGDAAP